MSYSTKCLSMSCRGSVYTMPHGDFIGFICLCLHHWLNFVNLSIDWPIKALLIENLPYGKYEMAVLWRVINIWGMFLLAAG